MFEARPASVDFAAFDRTTHYEHYVGVAVVGAAVSVLAGGAPKLGHSHDHCVLGQIAEVGPEGCYGLRELVENIGNLALGAAFVDVMVPAADVGERDLNSEIRFDELSQLFEAVAEVSVGTVGTGCGLVLRRVR